MPHHGIKFDRIRQAGGLGSVRKNGAQHIHATQPEPLKQIDGHDDVDHVKIWVRVNILL